MDNWQNAPRLSWRRLAAHAAEQQMDSATNISIRHWRLGQRLSIQREQPSSFYRR